MSDELFSGMKVPGPPGRLRERALRAARAAAPEAASRGRVPWGFRRLDLVWVGALLVLLASNALLTMSSRRAATLEAGRAAVAQREERAARSEDEGDLLALGVRLDATSPPPAPRVLSLVQVLRDGS
ncbi:MAG TPA: hypothetical protein VMT19_07715 [Thermoanaerobaculaceae bacterium]|nr:hypothetical protein [Thermoanaerobaculaceae bacterium]